MSQCIYYDMKIKKHVAAVVSVIHDLILCYV